MVSQTYLHNQKELMRKVFLLCLTHICELTFFGVKSIVAEFNVTIVKRSQQTCASLTCGFLYIISALIFRRSAQFRLYPIIFAHTIVILWLQTNRPTVQYLFFKIGMVFIVTLRAFWIMFFYRSFKNIFEWENFLKYESNEKLIGKCKFLIALYRNLISNAEKNRIRELLMSVFSLYIFFGIIKSFETFFQYRFATEIYYISNLLGVLIIFCMKFSRDIESKKLNWVCIGLLSTKCFFTVSDMIFIWISDSHFKT